jgi:hypothetical protein
LINLCFGGIVCCMLTIPEITPVRIKTEEIARELIDPGTGSRDFPYEVGPRVVYLDERFAYPPQPGDDPEAERARQERIWKKLGGNGVQLLDAQADKQIGSRIHDIKAEAADTIGNRTSAAYFERVYATAFGEDINLLIISTGITRYTGYPYHEIGYRRPRSRAR